MANIIHALEFVIVVLTLLIFYRISKVMVQRKPTERMEEIVNCPIETRVEPTISDEPLVETNRRSEELKESMRIAKEAASKEDPAIAKAREFANIQLQKTDKIYSDSLHTPGSFVDTAVGCFLVGALDYIGRQSSYSAKSRYELITKVLNGSANWNETFTPFDESQFDQAFLNDNIHITRAGAKAAKMWLKRPAVSDDFSIDVFIDQWQAV